MTPTPTQLRSRLLAAFLTGLTGLTGCTVGPDYRAPALQDLLPANFVHAPQDAGEPAASQRWWSAFQDPALDALVEATLRHNPDLDSAEANIRAARAGLDAALGSRQPQLSASARAGRDQFSRDSENFANLPFGNPSTGFNDYRAGFDASWEIDLFGHSRRNVESQAALLGTVEQQRADVALRLVAETVRNVVDYRYWNRRHANALAMVADERELLRLVRLQQQAGLASASDVTQAAAGVHAAEAGVPALLAAREATVAALGQLTALPLPALTGQLASGAPERMEAFAVPVGTPSALLRRRPDLRVAERRLAASSAAVGVAVADQYPRFSLVGGAGWDSIHPGRLGEEASRYWNLGPQLSVPLFSGGRLQAAVSASEADRDAALAAYRSAVLAALTDVETALIRCQGERARQAQLVLQRADLARQLAYAQTRVESGDVTRSELLAARLQLASVDDQELASGQALADDLVALFKALGGGIEPDAAGPAGAPPAAAGH